MDSTSENFDDANLLLVDDDPGTIQILRRILSRYTEIRFATSGPVALELARKQAPDLIVLDYEMPGVSGADTFLALRAEPGLKDIPVIFVTSHVGTQLESEMLDLGAADFIAKPLVPLVVQARVRTQLRLKRLTDQLRNVARIDGLTGVANRLAFDEALDREWRRGARENTALSLLMIDVDHFKKYNDSLGHLAGDEVLRRVAACLASVVRRGADLVCRYGGEEFAVILPQTEMASAIDIAEKLRAAVAACAIPHPDSPIGPWLSVSIGVSSSVVEGQKAEHCGPTDLFKAADAALYDAKHAGRNRRAFRPCGCREAAPATSGPAR